MQTLIDFRRLLEHAARLSRFSVVIRPISIFAVVSTLTIAGCFQTSVPPEDDTSGPPPIAVGRNVDVSAARPNVAHTEMTLCADPRNPSRMLAGSHDDPADSWMHQMIGLQRNSVAYVTFDGGASWRPSLDVRPYAHFSADPACAYTADGAVVHSIMLLHTYYGREDGMLVFRSPDGGRTWGRPIHLDRGFADREYLAAGLPGTSASADVVLTGHQIPPFDVPNPKQKDAVFVYLSRDDGRTFTAMPFPTVAGGVPGTNAYLSDGSIVTSYVTESSDSAIGDIAETLRSTDGGRSFAAPAQVKNDTAGVKETTGGGLQVTDPIPQFAADTSLSKFRDRVYLVWATDRTDRFEVWFAFSKDKGKTWEQATLLDDDRVFDPHDAGKGPQQGTPAIAVNRNGVVGVAWQEWRPKGAGGGYRTLFTASTDGGETFLRPVPASSADFNPPAELFFGTVLGNTDMAGAKDHLDIIFGRHYGAFDRPGDTIGLAADSSGLFHALWPDNRTGTMQMWTAPIRVTAPIAEVSDVTRDVIVRFGQFAYNASSGRALVPVQLENGTSTRLRMPLLLQCVGKGRGKLLRPYATNADNDRVSEGAVWRFAGSGKTLAPGERTRSRDLVFWIDPQGIPNLNTMVEDMRLPMRVLAPTRE